MADDDSIVDRGAGESDHLQRLWTPYRMSYLAEGPLKQSNGNEAQPFTDKIGRASCRERV